MQTAPISSDEQGDDICRKAAKLADRCREIVSVHQASFIERYEQADGHLVIRRAGIGNRKFGFLIEASSADKQDSGESGRKRYCSWVNPRSQESAVFPGQIEVMEGAKHVIPSRVWLQRFDPVPVDLGKPLYLFQSGICLTASRSIELCLTFPDGEIGASGIGVAITGRQRTGENVEAASDAVDYRACLRANERIKGFDITEAINLFSRLRFGIYSDGVGLIPSPLSGAFHKDWDLGSGPLDCSLSV